MPYLLLVAGAVLVYALFGRRESKEDVYEDARRNRMRVLNQQPPNEWEL